MATTEELYRLHIAPRKEEAARRAAIRQAAIERGWKRGRTPTKEEKECAEHGHYPLGTWAIQTTPSGKRLSKCGRCNQGYEMPSNFLRIK